VGSYTGAARPHWMDNPASHASADDPVYAESPGAAVYNMICNNCHGPQADAHGRLADNLLVMTGGNAAVANLREGLFGPSSSPGDNRQMPFGMLPPNIPASAPWALVSVDDRAARYMAWMASGGTEVTIPLPVLQLVANTSVLGVTRLLPTSSISGNMLAVAKSLCYSVLFGDLEAEYLAGGTASGAWFSPDRSGVHETDNPALITSNGDAELWLRLCSAGNPPPVRAVHGHASNGPSRIVVSVDSKGRFYSKDLIAPSVYGANPIGNHLGATDPAGITAENLRPYCYRASSAAGASDAPLCPPYKVASDGTVSGIDSPGASLILDIGLTPDLVSETLEPLCKNGCWGPNEADRWASRGAINAGFAVFLYLDAITKGTLQRLPDYNQCEQLP
jgi:hypothetical protein